MINSIKKLAYLNEAKIFVEKSTDNIKVILVAEMPTGTQKIGRSEAVKLSGTLNYINGKDVWQQHRSIESKAYQGLGYATDMLAALLREIHNNNGVTVSFSRPSLDAQSHNISLINKSGFKVTKVCIIEGSVRAICLANPTDVLNVLKSGDISPGLSEENDDFLENIIDKVSNFFKPEISKQLENLFSSPYGDIELPGYLIHAGLMLEWDGIKPSIPVIDSWSPDYQENIIYQNFLDRKNLAQSPEEEKQIELEYSKGLENLKREQELREQQVLDIRYPGFFNKLKRKFNIFDKLKAASILLSSNSLEKEAKEILNLSYLYKNQE